MPMAVNGSTANSLSVGSTSRKPPRWDSSVRPSSERVRPRRLSCGNRLRPGWSISMAIKNKLQQISWKPASSTVPTEWKTVPVCSCSLSQPTRHQTPKPLMITSPTSCHGLKRWSRKRQTATSTGQRQDCRIRHWWNTIRTTLISCLPWWTLPTTSIMQNTSTPCASVSWRNTLPIPIPLPRRTSTNTWRRIWR